MPLIITSRALFAASIAFIMTMADLPQAAAQEPSGTIVASATDMSGVSPKAQPAPAVDGPDTVQNKSNPHAGFGVSAGYAMHSGQLRPASNSNLSYSSEGPGFGLDYQSRAMDGYSALLFLAGSVGPLSGSLGSYYDTLGVGEIGVEVRKWIESFFAGVRAGTYTITFSDRSSRENDRFYFSNFFLGASGGYESSSGFFVAGDIDYAPKLAFSKVSVRADATSPRMTLSGGTGDAFSVWALVGYRWK